MRRLRFRFQRLLEIKERLEEARERDLGAAVATLTREQEALEGLHRTQSLYRRAAEAQPARFLDVGLLQLNFSFDLRLQRQIQEQLRRVRQAEAAVEEQRRRLVEASRERRVYEILKEQVAARHRRQQRRQEQRWLDEVGEQRHQRRREQQQ